MCMDHVYDDMYVYMFLSVALFNASGPETGGALRRLLEPSSDASAATSHGPGGFCPLSVSIILTVRRIGMMRMVMVL